MENKYKKYFLGIGSLLAVSTITFIGLSVIEKNDNIKSEDYKNFHSNTNNKALKLFSGTLLTKIDVAALGWNNKTEITLADWKASAPNVTTIGVDAFSNHSSLVSIAIPNSIKKIGNFSFRLTTKLEKVTFESNSQITEIGNGAFLSSSILSIIIPSSIKIIGTQCFQGAWRLASVTFENNSKLIEIPDFTFALSPITSIAIPDSVTAIRNSAFEDTKNLKTVTFGTKSKLRMILAGAFLNSGIISIKLPSSVTSIGDNAFGNTSSLLGENISMIGELKKGSASPLYGLTQRQWDNIIWMPSPFHGTLLNAADVINLGWETKNTITLDDWEQWAPNVTQIGDSAFSNNKFIASMIIPYKVISIGNNGFSEASSLATITFEPNSRLSTIGVEAFLSTSLISIHVPNAVIAIGNNAFNNISTLLGEDISMLRTLRKSSIEPLYGFTQKQWDAINWRPAPFPGETLTTLDVNDLGWNNKTWITLSDWQEWAPNVTEIQGAFKSVITLESIEIPSKITILNSSSFASTISLRLITFEEGSQLKTIGSSSFQDSGITAISIPKSVTSIGENAFLNTESLIDIEMNSRFKEKISSSNYGFTETQINNIVWIDTSTFLDKKENIILLSVGLGVAAIVLICNLIIVIVIKIRKKREKN